MATKNAIFAEHKTAYYQADKKEKGRILDHVCFVASMHRKAAVRKFGALQMKDPGIPERRGRSVVYTADVTVALKDIWNAGNEVCGELLHPVIAEYVTILQRDRMWKHSEEATTKLLRMSNVTVNPPPFLVLDETDAALDEANSYRYAGMLKELSKKAQLVVITHNRATMNVAPILYGVTMGADGVSKLLSIKLEEAENVLAKK